MRQINEAFGIKPPFETNVIPSNLVSIISCYLKKEEQNNISVSQELCNG